MAKTHEIVALIPARGGSKRLPGKNTRDFLGKPLIVHTIEAALSCAAIDAVYVSTDSEAIAEVSRASGALVPGLRPEALATDDASAMAVVQAFLKTTFPGGFPDCLPETLLLLQPTSPLRSGKHIEEALAFYATLPKPCSLVSVTLVKPIGWQGTIDPVSGEFQPFPVPEPLASQPAYQLNGAIYCSAPGRFFEDIFYSRPVYPYVMPPETAVDIDTPLDFEWAQYIAGTMFPLTRHCVPPSPSRGEGSML